MCNTFPSACRNAGTSMTNFRVWAHLDGTAPAPEDSTSPSSTSTDTSELVSTDTASDGASVPTPTPFTSMTSETSSVEFDSATDPMFPEFGTASVYEHLGCFMDSVADRILGHVLESPEMTPDVRIAEPINELKPCVFQNFGMYVFYKSDCMRFGVKKKTSGFPMKNVP